MVEVLFLGKLMSVMGVKSIRFDLHKDLHSKHALIAYLAGLDVEKTEALSSPNVKLIIDNKIIREDMIHPSAQTIAFAPPMIGG